MEIVCKTFDGDFNFNTNILHVRVQKGRRRMRSAHPPRMGINMSMLSDDDDGSATAHAPVFSFMSSSRSSMVAPPQDSAATRDRAEPPVPSSEHN